MNRPVQSKLDQNDDLLNPAWLFVCVDDPRQLRSASGIFARSMLTALRRFGDTALLVVPGVPNDSLIRRRFNQAASLILQRSALEGTVYAARIRREVRAFADQFPGRPILLNHLRSACFLAHPGNIPDSPIIYLAQNSEAEAAQSLAELATNPIVRWILSREAARIGYLEAVVTSKVSHVVTLTEEDAARFAHAYKATCLPPVIESDSIPSPAVEQSGDGKTVCLISSFHWAPKRWNAYWVMREVMPLVWEKQPDARLVVVGAGAARLRPSSQGVSIESDVADIRPYFDRADVIIVPDRQRSGLKFKTVQAALASKAIVSTSAGIEGTDLRHGESVLVGSSAEEFAEAIIELISKPDRKATLGSRARAVAEKRFNPARVMDLFDRFLDQLEEDTRTCAQAAQR